MIGKGHEKVLIFEDDIRFEPFFVAKLENLLEELDDKPDIWDLVFLGMYLNMYLRYLLGVVTLEESLNDK